MKNTNYIQNEINRLRVDNAVSYLAWDIDLIREYMKGGTIKDVVKTMSQLKGSVKELEKTIGEVIEWHKKNH